MPEFMRHPAIAVVVPAASAVSIEGGTSIRFNFAPLGRLVGIEVNGLEVRK